MHPEGQVSEPGSPPLLAENCLTMSRGTNGGNQQVEPTLGDRDISSKGVGNRRGALRDVKERLSPS